ncbi:MAG: type IIL restriction-modification enzyme MmeI [Gemmatales bacterium]
MPIKSPQEFINKWQKVTLSERSACQQHFLDLCELLGQPKPAEADPQGAWYTFERGVRKEEGGHGWADVWMRKHFGWEYKGKHKDLKAAYKQLLLYRNDLENPPLLIVCDMDKFIIHTNFTGFAEDILEFDLESLHKPENLSILRRVFTDPESFRPTLTTTKLTERAAQRFAKLAEFMRKRDIPNDKIAHFLMKLMFCMFAEDINLLPDELFTKLVHGAKNDSKQLSRRLENLFKAMHTGGDFGPEAIDYFNGGLFNDHEVFDLKPNEIDQVMEAASYDWSQVEPSIFGTLFERLLDPAKRSQIGAHYTSREDIETLLKPVMMQPLEREWEAAKAKAEKLWKTVSDAGKDQKARKSARKSFDAHMQDFHHRLTEVSVLDPACGSGNFLYVALNLLMNLEKEVIAFAVDHGVSFYPLVKPTQLHGIEINPYAQQLAQVVIWIGYLQWMHQNLFEVNKNPILSPVDTIECKDAILDLSNPERPKEPVWPKADYIVGNPPFLGNRFVSNMLAKDYLKALFKTYEQELNGRPDLCCYWFELARRQIEKGLCKRAGLLATQGIRGANNSHVLDKINKSGAIFYAISDQNWILDGATVHVSIICFDNGQEKNRLLDGQPVTTINSNLSQNANVTIARALKENQDIGFQGGIKRGSFDINEAIAMQYIADFSNPTLKPNSDVIVPYFNGLDIGRRARDVWIISYPAGTTIEQASLYEKPFEYLKKKVYPERQATNQQQARDYWWLHWNIRKTMNSKLSKLDRYIVTQRVSKHRYFAFLPSSSYPDCQLIVFAKDDYAFFGTVHSRVHEVWTREPGNTSQLRERESGLRYTPTTCFETFPFPKPSKAQEAAIAAAAKELDTLRNNWLNPPEWTKEEVLEFPGSTTGPWARYVTNPNAKGIGTVRYPRIVPKDEAFAKRLKERTLTKLYNARPTWLDLAHKKLDEAVFAAYGWPPDMKDEEILAKLLALNLERAAEEARGNKKGK